MRESVIISAQPAKVSEDQNLAEDQSKMSEVGEGTSGHHIAGVEVSIVLLLLSYQDTRGSKSMSLQRQGNLYFVSY